MPVLTEPPSMGDVLKYEVNPNYTREVITLLIGTNFRPVPSLAASPPAANTRCRRPPVPMAHRSPSRSSSIR